MVAKVNVDTDIVFNSRFFGNDVFHAGDDLSGVSLCETESESNILSIGVGCRFGHFYNDFF